jgi:hypothetical protein
MKDEYMLEYLFWDFIRMMKYRLFGKSNIIKKQKFIVWHGLIWWYDGVLSEPCLFFRD